MVDYEKRPMFEDELKEKADSSDWSYDSEDENLHLVKSISNVSRQRSHINEKAQGPGQKKYE